MQQAIILQNKSKLVNDISLRKQKTRKWKQQCRHTWSTVHCECKCGASRSINFYTYASKMLTWHSHHRVWHRTDKAQACTHLNLHICKVPKMKTTTFLNKLPSLVVQLSSNFILHLPPTWAIHKKSTTWSPITKILFFLIISWWIILSWNGICQVP